MSYCKQEGKDEIIFVTKDDMDKPSTAIIKDDGDDDEEPGLILPNGDINWNCPCLGGMASGPCGMAFREAFSCFHHSEAEPKGSDCYESFRKMQDCMQGYPELYPTKEEEGESSMDMPDETGDSKGPKGEAAKETVASGNEKKSMSS